MSLVINLEACLSSNPETKVVSHVQGLNGRVNETSTGKKFYVTKFLIVNGKNSIVKSQNRWANESGQFDLSVTQYNKYLLDKESEGELVRFEIKDGLVPYAVKGEIQDHATLLVMDGESKTAILESFNTRNVRALEMVSATEGEGLGGN